MESVVFCKVTDKKVTCILSFLKLSFMLENTSYFKCTKENDFLKNYLIIILSNY